MLNFLQFKIFRCLVYKSTGPQKTFNGGFNLYEIGEHDQHE